MGDTQALCLICCYSFRRDLQHESAELATDTGEIGEAGVGISLSNHKQFKLFCQQLELIGDGSGEGMKDLFTSSFLELLESPSCKGSLEVCPSCLAMISQAVDFRSKAEEVECHVRGLQQEIQKLLKEVKAHMGSFYLEVKKIEETVKISDVNCLEACISKVRRESGADRLKNEVELFRNGIFEVAKELDVFQSSLNRITGTGVKSGSSQAMLKEVPVSRTSTSRHSRSTFNPEEVVSQVLLEYDAQNMTAWVGETLPVIVKVEEEIPFQLEANDEEMFPGIMVMDDINLIDTAELHKYFSFSLDEGDGSEGDRGKDDLDLEYIPPSKKRKGNKKVVAPKQNMTLRARPQSQKSTYNKPRKSLPRMKNSTEAKPAEAGSSHQADHDPSLSKEKKVFQKPKMPSARKGRKKQNSPTRKLISKFQRLPHSMSKFNINSTHDKLSTMAPFKKRMVCRALQRQLRFEEEELLAQSSGKEIDIEVKHNLRRLNFVKYNLEEDRLMIGGVEIVVNRFKTLQCSLCSYAPSPNEKSGKKTKEQDLEKALLKHVISKHMGPFSCPLCQEIFQLEGQYHAHLRKHKDPTTSSCDICGKPFPPTYNIQLHTWSHMNEEEKEEARRNGAENPETRVKCLFCEMTFKNTMFMKRHVARYHTNAAVDRPCICNICGKGYKTNDCLWAHKQIHNPNLDWKCGKGCGREFNQRKNWKRHEESCKGESGKQVKEEQI